MGDLFGGDDGGQDPNPIKSEAMRTLEAQRAIAPHQLTALWEFGPQFAEAYGNAMAATYEGTLGAYENQIAPALSRVQTQQRGADLADVERYGARSRQAILDSNPDTARLLKLLNDDAETGLAAGSKLDPNSTRRISRGVANDYSRRGFTGRIPSADLEQAMQMYSNAEATRDSRRKFAGNVLGYNQAVVGDPFMQILGRSGQSMGQATNLAQLGQGQVSQSGAGNLYDPFRDAYSTMFQKQDAQAATDAANRQLIGTSIGGAATIGAALICWAAREVFGEETTNNQHPTSNIQRPTWKVFRHWLLTEAPDKLRNWYIVNGEKWAARLKKNPKAKAVVRRWMERRIRHHSNTPSLQHSKELYAS